MTFTGINGHAELVALARQLMTVAPSAIAAASKTSTVPSSQCQDELPGQSRLVGSVAEQDRADVADQSGVVGGDLQGMVPPVMLHPEHNPPRCEILAHSTRPVTGPPRCQSTLNSGG